MNGICVSLFKFHTWVLKQFLALPKMAPSTQTYKSITFIWIVWSTLYLYLWCQHKFWIRSSSLNNDPWQWYIKDGVIHVVTTSLQPRYCHYRLDCNDSKRQTEFLFLPHCLFFFKYWKKSTSVFDSMIWSDQRSDYFLRSKACAIYGVQTYEFQ